MRSISIAEQLLIMSLIGDLIELQALLEARPDKIIITNQRKP